MIRPCFLRQEVRSLNVTPGSKFRGTPSCVVYLRNERFNVIVISRQTEAKER